MDSSEIPTCIACTEEYPFMNTIKHPICGLCEYNDLLKSASNLDSIPPLKYCKDGCGMTLPRNATDMCRPCQRKSGQLTQQPPPLPNAPLRAEELSPASINAIKATIKLPCRPAANPNQFRTPARSLSNHSDRVVPTPTPVSRPIKRPALDQPKLFESTPIMPDHAEVYKHGETSAKRIRMDRIQEKNKKKIPRSTAIGRSNKKRNNSPAGPLIQRVVVKLRYNTQSGSKSHGVPDYTHDINFSDTSWELEVARSATKHFVENSIGIFPPSTKSRKAEQLLYPALPPYDSAFYSLGVGTAKLSGDLLKNEILSPTRQPGQRKTRGPIVITLLFAAATYLASLVPTSSQFDSNSENGRSKQYNQSDQSDESDEGEGNKGVVEFVDFSAPVPAINQMGSWAVTDVDEQLTWSDALSKAVNLSIRRIHQLANEGINPLTISVHSVVAARAKSDTSTSDGPQDYATPLPDGYPAGPDQTITVISWSDAVQLRLRIGRRLSLMEPSWIRSFGDVLPELEEEIRDDMDVMPWSNGLLIALVTQSDDSSLDPSLKNLKFGQWWAMQDIKKDLIGKGTRRSSYKGTIFVDGKARPVVVKKIMNIENCNEETYLTELAVYHLTLCLLEQFKIAMFFSIHVTDDQKRLLNTIQVVFNMILLTLIEDKPDKMYHIEEVLDQPLEVICTTRNFGPSRPESLLSDCLNGFVHFTYDYFRGQALVSNIKVKDGLLTGMRMVDLRYKWSCDNPHQDGIDAFISTHSCGTACFALDLKPAYFKYEKVGKQDTMQLNDSKAKPEHEKSNLCEEDAEDKTSELEEDASKTWCNQSEGSSHEDNVQTHVVDCLN
ncbi:hypothetical protein DFH28DRAFT_115631 [Melampsora americana]|nr:hypothetical protein DFH28DRAFT_115631 [Melampsora americana]